MFSNKWANALRNGVTGMYELDNYCILEIRISGIVRLGAAACWILVCRLNSCIFLYAKDKPEPPSLNNCHSWIFLVDCVRHVWTHTQITRLFFSIHWKFLNTCKKWDIQVQDRVPHRENRFKAWNNRFYLRKLNLLSYHHHQIILNLTTFFLRWVVVSFTDHTSTKWGPL